MRTQNVVSRTKQVLSGAALAVALVPGTPSPAMAGSDFAAGVVTGVIGSAIVRDINRKNKQNHAAPAPAPAPRATYRATANGTVRQEQTALNFFGFPAGYADGVMGRRTRDAIAGFQGWMGYPVSGYLDAYQQQFLLDSYNRAMAGGALTQQQIAADPNGARGLLLTYRKEMTAPAPVAAAPAVPTN